MAVTYAIRMKKDAYIKVLQTCIIGMKNKQPKFNDSLIHKYILI